jgi:hypothetical protein
MVKLAFSQCVAGTVLQPMECRTKLALVLTKEYLLICISTA